MSQSPTYYGDWVASLPMYDWPERRAEVDAQWAQIRDALRASGIDAPERLARRNADLPPVPGGIRSRDGDVIAPDPATLPPEELDLPTLWRHPKLLLAQTCWGPMQTTGLAGHVRVVGQPGYSDCEGGQGEFYSSVIVMRGEGRTAVPADGGALLPLDLLREKRLAYNGEDSMSGLLALSRDLKAAGKDLGIFASRARTGSHRASAEAVAAGEADVAALDCRSWAGFARFEPAAAAKLSVVGWTAKSKGLPYICARALPEEIFRSCRAILEEPSAPMRV